MKVSHYGVHDNAYKYTLRCKNYPTSSTGDNDDDFANNISFKITEDYCKCLK